MISRPAKWYRSDKRVLRSFARRLWYGATRMRGQHHQCRCAMRRLWFTGRDHWKDWRPMFEPVRIAKKVYRSRRAVPFWSRKP